MIKQIKVLGLITARGGSKSIPHKNIKELHGKPLIAYTIEAAQKSKLLSHTIVSTDDGEIAELAKQYGADVPFLRPAEISKDESTSFEAVHHALTWLKENGGETYDYVLILQPTSPLRIASDIDASIVIAAETGADSVMGMVELTDFSLKKLKKIEDGIILPYGEAEGKFSSMRQHLDKVYKRNAAIYLTKVSCLLGNDLFGKVSRAYIMPEERSVDINKPVDFELAEFFLKKRASR